MAQYHQLGSNAANTGWFIDSNGQIVLLINGTVRHTINDDNGNVTLGGTLTASGGGALTGTWSNLGTVTTVDINGGSIDGATIGANSASTGAFTTLSTTGLTSTTSGVGAVAAEGTLVGEYGVSKIHVTKLTFTKTQAVAGAALSFGARCYTMPAVPVLVKGIYVSATLTAPTDTANPEVGVGTVIGSGANATLGAVGATAEDIIEGTAGTSFSAGGAAITRNSVIAKCPQILAASSVIHLNVAATFTQTEDVVVAGTMFIAWEELG